MTLKWHGTNLFTVSEEGPGELDSPIHMTSTSTRSPDLPGGSGTF